MENYLLELFKEENTVIIPDLGALTLVDRSKNELMFMSFMKHNDGTLAKCIAETEGVDLDAANAQITAFTTFVREKMKAEGSFTLAGIGTFELDAAGEISFNQLKKDVPKKDMKSEVTPPPVVEKVVEEKVAEKKVKQVKETKTETKKEDLKIASEQEQWEDDLDLPPLNYEPERPKKPVLEKTQKDKKRRRYSGIIWLFVAALVVTITAYVGMNYSTLKEKIPFLASNKAQVEVNETVTDESQEELITEVQSTVEESIDSQENQLEEDDETESDNLEMDTEDRAEEQSTETTVAPAPVQSQQGLTFDSNLPIQVITGAFANPNNAQRLVEKLNAMGFPAAIIQQGGLNMVSVASFDSMDAYQANKANLAQVGDYWVKK